METVKTINHIATQGLTPDLTILLDIPVEEGLARKMTRKHDRFELEEVAFHRRVRAGYLKMAAAEPTRWLVVDARQSKSKIRQVIWERVNQLLKKRS